MRVLHRLSMRSISRSEARPLAFVLASSAYVAVMAVACPFGAPQAQPGAGPEEACGTDLDCDSGLVCTCGTCADPTAVDQPPSCDVGDDLCPTVPSACVEEEDIAIECVGAVPNGFTANCQNGVESCPTGVPETACGACGIVRVGFICVDGAEQCLNPAAVAPGC